MFNNYAFLNWLLNKIESEYRFGREKNELHKHLEWLLKQGENRCVQLFCSSCNSQPAVFASIYGSGRYGYSISSNYLSCSDQNCLEDLRINADNCNVFIKLCFSNILWFSRKNDQKQFVDLLKETFNIPKRITRKSAFDFFIS
ncbi:MAG: hypothetical protein PHW50_02895 [Patescibacteria group bacterium]|nr:hypothetical protein [Patescibacteria group bacterium]